MIPLKILLKFLAVVKNLVLDFVPHLSLSIGDYVIYVLYDRHHDEISRSLFQEFVAMPVQQQRGRLNIERISLTTICWSA